MKIGLVLYPYLGHAPETERFMLKVCGLLGAEAVIFKSETGFPDTGIANARVDMAMIQVGEGRDNGIFLAERLLTDGVECLLIGTESFNRSPQYPLYSVPGPPDERADQDWYVEDIAQTMRMGPLTQSAVVDDVIKRVRESQEAVAKAGSGLEKAKAAMSEAEEFRDNYLKILSKIHAWREQRTR